MFRKFTGQMFLTLGLLLVAAGLRAQYFPVKDNGKWGLMDKTGRQVMPFVSNWIPDVKGEFAIAGTTGNVGCYEISKGWFLQPVFTSVVWRQNSVVEMRSPSAGNPGQIEIGIAHLEKKWIVEPTFIRVDEFSRSGTAKVQFLSCHVPNCVEEGWGFVDTLGNVIATQRYEEMQPAPGRNFIIRVNGGYGACDSAGNELILPFNDEVFFLNTEIIICRQGSTYSLVNLKTNIRSEIPGTKVTQFTDSLLRIKGNGGYGLLSFDLSEVLPLKFDEVTRMSNGFVRANKKNQQGMYSVSGREILSVNWDNISPISPGHVLVFQKSLCGLADTTGKIIIPPKYASISRGANNDWVCQLSDNLVLVDSTGKEIFTLQAEAISPMRYNVALFKRDNKWGVIHQTGKILLPPQFSAIEVYDGVVLATRGQEKINYSYNPDGTLSDTPKLIIGSVSLGEPLTIDAAFRSANWLSNSVQPVTSKLDSLRAAVGWFSQPTTPDGIYYHWGLRRNSDLEELIPPTYDNVHPCAGKNVTLTCEYTRNEALYGLVNHVTGKVIVVPTMRFVQEDSGKSLFLRAMFQGNEKYSLVSMKKGPVLIPGLSYAGELCDGMRRYNTNGQASFDKRSPVWVERKVPAKKLNNADSVSIKISVSGGKWGYLDANGKVLKVPEYEMAGNFFRGQAIVKSGGKWGVIDKNFRWVIPNQYDEIALTDSSLSNPTYILSIKQQRVGYTDTEGRYLISSEYENMGAVSENIVSVATSKYNWTYFHANGLRLTDTIYAEAGDFHEGLAKVRSRNSKYFHYIDKNGVAVIRDNITRAGNFSSGLAPAQKGTWGYLNHNGEWAIEPKYNFAGEFNRGAAIVMRNGKSALIDSTGKILIPFADQKMGPFNEDYLRVRINGGYGLVNVKGEIILKPRYQDIGFPCDSLIRIKMDNMYGYTDMEGRIVIKPQFAQAQDFYNGLAVVSSSGKWFIIDKAGKKISENSFQSVEGHFSDGCLAVKMREVWEYVNRSGLIITPEHFIATRQFSDGLGAIQKTNKKWGFADSTGTVVISCQFASVSDFVNGRAWAREGKYQGWIDKSGNWTHSPSFGDCTFEKDRVRITSHFKHGLADNKGKIIIPVEMDVIELKNKLLRISHQGKEGYALTNGEWVWEMSK